MNERPQAPSFPTSARSADYVAIALVSAAVMLFEITSTRILSVILWYHFAFLAISLALLGLGLPGVWLSLRRPSPTALDRALLCSAIAAPLALIVLFRFGTVIHFSSAAPGAHMFFNTGLLLVVVCVLVPLLCFGSAVCLLLMRANGRSIGWMYGADLLGATLGAASVVPLMYGVSTPLITAGTSLLAAIALCVTSPRRRVTGALLVAASCALLVWGKPYELTYSKSYVEPNNIVFDKWTPTARITIFPSVFYVKDPNAAFGWGMGSKYEPRPLKQMWIEQDGSAGTPITRLERSPRELDHLFFDVTSIGYQIRPPKKACVIGAGGGRDVLTALKTGAADVDAVELNGATVDAVSGPLGAFSGDVYHLPGVHAHVSEGRSFLTRSQQTYDLIQISLIDSWAATAAGAYSLSENYLYTVQALRLYMSRLAPNGIVSISRWMSGERELEGARLANMIVEALRLEGASEPKRHLLVAQAWSVGTFVFGKRAFDDADLAAFESISEQRGFRVRWPVDAAAAKKTPVGRVLREGTAAYAGLGLDLSVSNDDRPFFFQTVSPFSSVDSEYMERLSNNEHSVAMLRWLMALISIATLGLFFLPFVARQVIEYTPGFWRGSSYFLCIGLSFMLVEMPWLQRFVLYLGHPSYATTVVLASLLLGAGSGSMLVARLPAAPIARYGALLPAVIVVVNLLLDPLFSHTIGFGLAARVALAALVLIPAGVLMGFAFPLGMLAFGDENKPWFWAINGASSVLASVFSLVLAMRFGFSATVLMGSALYVVAWAVLRVQSFAVSSTEASDANHAASDADPSSSRVAAE